MTSKLPSTDQIRFWHTTFNTVGNVVMFATEADVRRAVHALARVSPDELVSFCFVDTHAHLHAANGRRHAGVLTRRVQRAIAPIAAAPLQPTHFTPVRDQRHNANLVQYLIRQPTHHELPGHPALWSGSALLDLIGARHVDGLSLQLRTWMPRFRVPALLAAAGLPARPLPDLDTPAIRQLGAGRIAAAAAAASCADPALAGRGSSVLRARRAAVHLASRAGVRSIDLAAALSITTPSVRRHRAAPRDDRLIAAVIRRLALEELCAERGPSG